MPPKSTIIEGDMTWADMKEVMLRATAKQFEEIPCSALIMIAMPFNIRVRKTYNMKSGKTTYERKSAT